MGKSSSSRKKKRPKDSSQARKKRRSKVRSRKHKSKKLRRHFSDDEDSRNSTSGSSSYSSGSEDDKYRGKSSRIRARKDVKSSNKKGSRKRSYSSESIEDSPRAHKKKGPKRKHDYENKNKTYFKKRRRRDYSTSSISSGSWSCSTCRSDSGSSHEVESEKRRSKHEKEERDGRISGEVESPSKRSRYRYRSRSPSHSRFSESSTYQNEENVWVENNSRRLRSIVIVAERDKEDRELIKDEDKEEITHDHGDLPPCRSNDSNDVENKWEEGDYSSHNEVEKMRLESEQGNETAVSDLRSNKHAQSGHISDTDDGSQFDGMANILNSDDLEYVLRERALENLRRFRGGLQTGGRTTANNDESGGDVKQSSILNAESVQTRSNTEDGVRVVGATFSKGDGAEAVVSTETTSGKGVRVPLTGKDTNSSSKIDENATDEKTCDNDSVSVKQNVARLTRQMTITGNFKEKISTGISMEQPKLAAPALTHQFLKSYSTPKQALEPESEEPRANVLLPKSSLDETLAVTALPATPNSNNSNINKNNGTDVNNACSSAASEISLLKSTPVETSADKPLDEAHEGSQFEQKTMSVMRGGEMVNVSYKVYIPKKAPALARRQLKR